ncbi:MAG: VOC family protein [Bacteroidetes bacterium]|nr:VOC family protein [Bacteroidota bacterium]
MITCIAGIQQLGIGIPNVVEAFTWYRRHFGVDVPIFDEAAEANLMLPYTGGKPHMRRAILAINMNGGGGFEIWQYTSRTPQPAKFNIQLGDLGVFCGKIKAKNVAIAHQFLSTKNVPFITELLTSPSNQPHFFVKDPYGNWFEIIESEDWFGNGKYPTGGTAGSIIGVSNMDKSINFYKNLLGYTSVVYDKEGIFDDLKHLPLGDKKIRRVLLRHPNIRKGAFSKLLGKTEIELIQNYEHTPRKIFENRFWGDLGFIHMCFDVTNMKEVKSECESFGHPFTVYSGEKFEMGEAGGSFSYIEDPDGYFIEFVETHKVPILKKLGWYLNLKKRDPEKSLPTWMLKALALGRVKN